MRLSVLTLGCKVNRYESRALEEALERRGHEVVPFGEPVEAVVLNSCTVTHRSDRDVRALVRRARRGSPDARILVTGCYAQVDPEALRALGVDAVVGTDHKAEIPEMLEEAFEGVWVGDLDRRDPLSAEPVTRFEGRSRAFLKVQDGCEAFCTYCIVPYARGPSRSLPPREVRIGLRRLRESGHGEVVLTGVHLGLWGQDLAPPRPFGELLDEAESSGIPRVRLSSLEPREITAEVVGRIAASEVLCPHLHVPLQSGCTRVLEAMGRPYTAPEFREVVERAVGGIPGLCLGLDVIVGFPGETEAGFRETWRFLEEIPFAYLHVFPYSPRRGTRAFELPDRIPAGVVKERARELRQLSRRKREAFYRAHAGQTLRALPEGRASGGELSLRTRNYIPVRISWAGEEPSGEVPVMLERVEGDVMVGVCAE